MRRLLITLAAIGGALLVGGIAYATIPDANGVVHACYNTSNANGYPNGALRAIDTAKVNGHCGQGEAPVDLATPQYVQSAISSAQSVSSGWIYPFQARPQPDGHVATFSFQAPAAGFAVVTAHIGVRVHTNPSADCHIQSQVADAPAVLPNVQPSTTDMPGYTDNWVNGNLPTENGAGTYLELDQSTSRVFPVVAGSNTVYLNGAYTGYSGGDDDCADALWGPIQMTATFAQTSSPGTLTSP